ncbi:MAG TPA: glycosyltransferase family 4 protein [Candidatus Acidoferrum sp.]|jgi:glycosyltransferase involved in cell wall biosynthesis|nr:glycosyltransferase family 4 protein [Candidatus Acidoferrum sp.]
MTSSPLRPNERWIIAQEGSRESYAVPLAFHRLGSLRLFYVDIWCRRGRSLLRRGPESTRSLATRFHPEIPPELVMSFSPAAILTRALDHFRRDRLSAEALGDIYNQFGCWFALRVRAHLERLDLDPKRDFFFGFNTNCLEVLELLKEKRIHTIVDQVDPGKVEEDLVLEEAERWPGWSRAPGRMPQSYWDRLRAEWDLADLVLVNSDWSAQALVRQGVARGKIVVVPLALDLVVGHAFEPIHAKGTLRVLWLGSVILRKGIQYLVEAARRLQGQHVEFLLAGPLGIANDVVGRFPSNIKVLGRITRDQLSEVYKQAHLFVLPTISDGFAITQLEAMAHGLPVIATPNCGRVVTDGVDGLIVPARDSAALAEAVGRLDGDRGLLREMSRSALKTVARFDLPSNARMINNLALSHQRAQQRQPALCYA